MNKGFGVIIIMLVIAMLGVIALVFALENKGLEQALYYTRKESSGNVDKYQSLKDYKDEKFYFKEDSEQKDYYILENCRMIKLDYNKFIDLRENGYQ